MGKVGKQGRKVGEGWEWRGEGEMGEMVREMGHGS